MKWQKFGQIQFSHCVSAYMRTFWCFPILLGHECSCTEGTAKAGRWARGDWCSKLENPVSLLHDSVHHLILSVVWSDFRVVLYGARSWTLWSLWVPSNLGFSMTLYLSVDMLGQKWQKMIAETNTRCLSDIADALTKPLSTNWIIWSAICQIMSFYCLKAVRKAAAHLLTFIHWAAWLPSQYVSWETAAEIWAVIWCCLVGQACWESYQAQHDMVYPLQSNMSRCILWPPCLPDFLPMNVEDEGQQGCRCLCTTFCCGLTRNTWPRRSDASSISYPAWREPSHVQNLRIELDPRPVARTFILGGKDHRSFVDICIYAHMWAYICVYN